MLVFKLSNSQNVRYELKLNTYNSTYVYFKEEYFGGTFFASYIYFNTAKIP